MHVFCDAAAHSMTTGVCRKGSKVKCMCAYRILLILPKQDVEGTGEAPHRQHQQEQEPLDVLNDGP